MTSVDPRALRPHPQNPRLGDIGAIARSLQVNGQYRPVVVDAPTMVVLAGWHTVSAARALGWESVDAVLVDVDDETAARIVLADNRTADLGTYDSNDLTSLLRSLGDPDGTGYTPEDLDDLLAGIGVYDPADPAKAEADEPEGEKPSSGATAVAVGPFRFAVDGARLAGWLASLGPDPQGAILTRLGLTPEQTTAV